MVDSALFAALLSAAAAILTLGLWVLVWTKTYAAASVAFLTASLVAGQLLRLPLPGQGGGVLVSDVAAVATIVGAIIVTLKKRTVSPSVMLIASLSGIFLAWAPLMLFIGADIIPTSQIFIGLAYWARLAALLALIPALCVLCEDEKVKKSLFISSVTAGAVLVALGFIQYIFIPNLAFLAPAGWDPHIGRLTSTWLDPNFFGIFCVLYILLLLSSPLIRGVGGVIMLTYLALLLTQSRSAWLAAATTLFLVPFIVISLRRSLRPSTLRAGAFSLVMLVAATAGLTIIFFPDRLTGLALGDATVQLRASSLRLAWSAIVEPHWLAGVGYNAYQVYAQKAGLISSFTIHSRAGADNSVLTLWATTGLFGLILFAGWLTAIAAKLLAQWRSARTLPPLIALTALAVLLTHGLFINSFLYAHAFIVLAIIIALGWSQQNSNNLVSPLIFRHPPPDKGDGGGYE